LHISNTIKDYQDETLINIESKRINKREENPNKKPLKRFQINRL